MTAPTRGTIPATFRTIFRTFPGSNRTIRLCSFPLNFLLQFMLIQSKLFSAKGTPRKAEKSWKIKGCQNYRTWGMFHSPGVLPSSPFCFQFLSSFVSRLSRLWGHFLVLSDRDSDNNIGIQSWRCPRELRITIDKCGKTPIFLFCAKHASVRIRLCFSIAD